MGLPCCPYCKYHPVIVTREHRSPTWASFFDSWREKHGKIYFAFVIFPVMAIVILIKLIELPFFWLVYSFCCIVDKWFNLSLEYKLRDPQLASNGFRVYCPECGRAWHMPA